jgi:hypothetical protein
VSESDDETLTDGDRGFDELVSEVRGERRDGDDNNDGDAPLTTPVRDPEESPIISTSTKDRSWPGTRIAWGNDICRSKLCRRRSGKGDEGNAR